MVRQGVVLALAMAAICLSLFLFVVLFISCQYFRMKRKDMVLHPLPDLESKMENDNSGELPQGTQGTNNLPGLEMRVLI